ncbi:MAG: hypothetical protein ACRYG7_17935 [Janthinobacterium lividum]
MTLPLYSLVPFTQVGALRFGMSRADVLGLLGPVDREQKTYTGGLLERRKAIATIYKNDKLHEVTFSPGARVVVDNHLVLKQAGIDYLLATYPHHATAVGITVFPTLGMGFTGFGKSKDAKVVMAFDKRMLRKYLAF